MNIINLLTPPVVGSFVNLLNPDRMIVVKLTAPEYFTVYQRQVQADGEWRTLGSVQGISLSAGDVPFTFQMAVDGNSTGVLSRGMCCWDTGPYDSPQLNVLGAEAFPFGETEIDVTTGYDATAPKPRAINFRLEQTSDDECVLTGTEIRNESKQVLSTKNTPGCYLALWLTAGNFGEVTFKRGEESVTVAFSR